jgi:hypothetical protein
VLGDAGELLMVVEGGDVDEETPDGVQSGRVKSSGQPPESQ